MEKRKLMAEHLNMNMVEQESQTLPSLPWIAPSFFPEVLLWACIVNHELVSLGVEGSAGNFSAASGLHPWLAGKQDVALAA